MQIAYSFPNRHFPVHAFTVTCCKRMTRNLPQIHGRQGKCTLPHPTAATATTKSANFKVCLALSLCSLPSLLSSLGRDSSAPVESISSGAQEGCCRICPRG